MCNEAVQSNPSTLKYVPNLFVTQEIWNKAVQRIPWRLKTQEMWHDVLITWRKAYIKGKGRRAKIKEELMPVAWHPDRWWNWCVPEHKKKELKIYFA